MLLLAYELRSLNTMAVLFLFFLSLYVCAAIAGLPFKNPNVLMLVVDDLRPCLKPYGNPIVKAPAVEALINKSTQFHNAHAQVSLFSVFEWWRLQARSASDVYAVASPLWT